MDFMIATTTYTYRGQGSNSVATAAKTVYALTDKTLDLINFFSQFLTVAVGVIIGLLVFMILLLIFKS